MSYQPPDELYGLTPVQSGMLYHALSEPDTGVYVVQLHTELSGALDPARLRAAWERALARHSALRTAFLWDGLDNPLQAVRSRVDLPWSELNWSDAPEATQSERLASLLQDERSRGFDLARAPLMRVVLVRLANQRHLMLWTVHHLVVDGWSTVVLMDEVFAENLRLGAPDPWEGPEENSSAGAQFKDFVEWLGQRDGDSDRRFWSEALATHEQPAPIAVGRHTTVPLSGMGRRGRVLGRTRSSALRDWARRHRLTLATVMHGAWAQVLRRYAGGSSFTYGAVLSGRPATLPGVDRLVGPLLTTVPIAVAATPDETPLLQWLGKLQRRLAGIREHEHCAPLEIVEQRPPNTPRTLFNAVLVFENAPPGQTHEVEASATGVSVGPIRYLDQSHYDAALLVLPGDQLELTLMYRRSGLDEDGAELLLDHVESVLDSMLTSAEAPLGSHAPPGPAERTRVETEFQPSGYDGPVPDLSEFDVVERFRSWAATEPSRLAVLDRDDALSYDELNRRSDALSAQLQREGDTGAGVRIAILAGRQPELLVAMLGVLKTGSAYVPLDPSYPESRLRHMFEASGARSLVATLEQRDHPLAMLASRTTLVEPNPVGVPSPLAVQPETQPDDLAYVIFTSGSTGTPKGVGVTRRNIAYSTWARGPVYGEPPERFLLVSPISFDSSKVGLYWPLSTGGTLVLTPDRQERDPDALYATLRDQRITHVLYVPAIHEWILERCVEGDLPALRSVIVAGEECSASLVERHHQIMPTVRLFNEYGPSEATVWASVLRCYRQPDGSPPSIGRPIPGSRLLVLDRLGQPAPILVGGEIHIDGPGVTPGYLDDPAATAKAFVSLGSGPSGSSMYRTGDRGRFRPDGELEFLGRMDRQIKIRGHRVELKEIESALERHPAVSAAAVTYARGEGTPGPLVGWITSVRPTENGEDASPPDGRAVRGFLASRLPAHMLPDRIEVLEELPRGPNGKIDHAQLEGRVMSDFAAFVGGEPETETERRLSALWCEVLGVARVGAEESFFAVGGHSLLAVRLLGRIREEFQVDLSMDAVFEHPTVRALGARLDAWSSMESAGDRETFTF